MISLYIILKMKSIKTCLTIVIITLLIVLGAKTEENTLSKNDSVQKSLDAQNTFNNSTDLADLITSTSKLESTNFDDREANHMVSTDNPMTSDESSSRLTEDLNASINRPSTLAGDQVSSVANYEPVSTVTSTKNALPQTNGVSTAVPVAITLSLGLTVSSFTPKPSTITANFESLSSSTPLAESPMKNSSTPMNPPKIDTVTSSITLTQKAVDQTDQEKNTKSITITASSKATTLSTPLNLMTIVTNKIGKISSSTLQKNSTEDKSTSLNNLISSTTSFTEIPKNNNSSSSSLTKISTVTSPTILTQNIANQTDQEKTTISNATVSPVTISSTILTSTTLVTDKINQIASSTSQSISATDASATLSTNVNTMSSALVFLPRGALGKLYVSLCDVSCVKQPENFKQNCFRRDGKLFEIYEKCKSSDASNCVYCCMKSVNETKISYTGEKYKSQLNCVRNRMTKEEHSCADSKVKSIRDNIKNKHIQQIN